MVSAVLLPSGLADKIDEQRSLLPWRGKPMLQWTLESALASDLHEIICVVRDSESLGHKTTLNDERLYWLKTPAVDQGQSSSLIAGLWAIDPKSDGALFLPGDQPMIRPELINSLLERFENTNAPIVAPSFRGQIGNPILFRRNFFPKLLQLTGNQSSAIIIQKYRKRTVLVEWNSDLSLKDIEVRDDYERID